MPLSIIRENQHKRWSRYYSMMLSRDCKSAIVGSTPTSASQSKRQPHCGLLHSAACSFSWLPCAVPSQVIPTKRLQASYVVCLASGCNRDFPLDDCSTRQPV